MDFITTEAATELGLSEVQINGIKPLYESHIATERQTWDAKANDDAEKIIGGAIESTAKKYNIELPRNQGEKNADYLARLNEKVVEGKKGEIESLKSDYDKKLKEFNGGDATKAELQKAKDDLDAAQLKLVEFDQLKEKADKYEPLETKYKSLEERVYFQNEKPNFPDTVNKYEADAKWTAFTKTFDEKWNKEFDADGKSVAVSKENPHLKKPLSDLIGADAEITALLQGRKQEGLGHKQVGNVKVEGYDVPETAKNDTVERAKFIKDALVAKGLNPSTDEYSREFAKINKAIIEHK